MPIAEDKSLKVAAYCRVSTDREDQINSLDNQKNYFEEYICSNPDWELYRIYVDEGITGTSIKKRLGFHRMLSDARQNAFDLLLTKEISRFARNTLDSIYYTRRLKELGIGVIFLNDGINTLDKDAELRLTIMSSIAQEESRKISERVTWGQKRRMEQGVVFGRSMLGYEVKAGRIIVEKEGAKVVRSIFHRYVNEGKGVHTIAKELNEEGISTFYQKGKWSDSVVLKILCNEKYAGDLVQRKTYTKSYLSHEKKYNKGEKEFIVIRNHHDAIIPRELFELAKSERNRRRRSKAESIRHSTRYLLSGKIKCGFCKGSFIARTKIRKDKSLYLAWRCCRSASVVTSGRERCKGRQINNDLLMAVLKEIISGLKIDRTKVISEVKNMLQMVYREELGIVAESDFATKEKCLVQKKQRLITLFIEEKINKTEFVQYEERFKKELELIKEEQKKKSCPKESEEAVMNKLVEIEKTLEALLSGDAMEGGLYRNLLNYITVYERNHFRISLKGVTKEWEVFLDDM